MKISCASPILAVFLLSTHELPTAESAMVSANGMALGEVTATEAGSENPARTKRPISPNNWRIRFLPSSACRSIKSDFDFFRAEAGAKTDPAPYVRFAIEAKF